MEASSSHGPVHEIFLAKKGSHFRSLVPGAEESPPVQIPVTKMGNGEGGSAGSGRLPSESTRVPAALPEPWRLGAQG